MVQGAMGAAADNLWKWKRAGGALAGPGGTDVGPRVLTAELVHGLHGGCMKLHIIRSMPRWGERWLHCRSTLTGPTVFLSQHVRGVPPRAPDPDLGPALLSAPYLAANIADTYCAVNLARL